MRLFNDLMEAASEIKRDLAKSPLVTSTRVQNLRAEGQLREALDYSYCIDAMPIFATDLVQLGTHLGFWDKEQGDKLCLWLEDEFQARTVWDPGTITEAAHPHLAQLNHGDEPDYAYTDRLRGSIEAITEALRNDPDTRRAYHPIFYPQDTVVASRLVRIPCSLGYQALIRQANDGEKYLHPTYLQRACDFDKFWLTDIWLARQWQRELQENLIDAGLDDIRLGNTTHFITSLHSFITEEIY